MEDRREGRGETRARESINSLNERMATDTRFFRGLMPGRQECPHMRVDNSTLKVKTRSYLKVEGKMVE